MAEQKDIFLSTVVPIMDKVRDDLSRKRAAEYGRHASSFGAVMAGAGGPDGGMASMDAYNSIRLSFDTPVVSNPQKKADVALKMAQAIQLLNITGFERNEAVSIVSKVIGEVEMPSDMSSIFAQSSNDPQEREKLENEKQVGTNESQNTTGVPTDKETGKTV